MECAEGEDEENCDIPDWILYITVANGLLIIIMTLFFALKGTVKKYQQIGNLYQYN